MIKIQLGIPYVIRHCSILFIINDSAGKLNVCTMFFWFHALHSRTKKAVPLGVLRLRSCQTLLAAPRDYDPNLVKPWCKYHQTLGLS